MKFDFMYTNAPVYSTESNNDINETERAFCAVLS